MFLPFFQNYICLSKRQVFLGVLLPKTYIPQDLRGAPNEKNGLGFVTLDSFKSIVLRRPKLK
jgi:hypothetical protein